MASAVYIGTELELADVREEVPERPAAPPTAQESLVTRLTQWWATHALEPYLRTPSGLRLEPLRVRRVFLGGPVTFTVRFDSELLSDVLEAYAAYGWEAVEQVETIVAELPEAYAASGKFLRATRNVAAVLVAQALTEVEQSAVAFARARWRESKEMLEAWLARFSVATVNLEHPSLVDRELSAELLAACRRYADFRRQVLALQKEIDSRNRKTPPSQGPAGSGYALWFEVYAAPQRELLLRMGEELARIKELFPAAVLALDDLPSAVLDDASVVRDAFAATALEEAIYQRVRYLVEQLELLEASLSGPRATTALDEFAAPFLAGDVARLHDADPPDGGCEAAVLKAVLARTKDGDQRIMADLELLLALLDNDELTPVGTWNQVVLFRYCRTLAQEVDRRRASDARWAAIWSWVERIAAALALIALMAFFPFGEAAAPGLVAALSLAGSAAAVIGAVTLVLHHMIGNWQEAGKLDRAAADRLFRLGQDDPEAIAEIGEALTRSAALRRAVQEGALVTVITLGAAHRLKAVSVALDFQGFADDVETLFEPPTTGQEGDDGAEGQGDDGG